MMKRKAQTLATFVAVICSCGQVVAADDSQRSYAILLSITSKLEFAQTPMDPKINFGKIIRGAGLSGVLDPNSIRVINAATGRAVPIAIGEGFAYADEGRVEWVIENIGDTRYEIQFRLAEQRRPRAPQEYTPAIGVGDLLRYNGGRDRPITLFYAAALADLTGDGKSDLVGCWNYAYRPGDPQSGVICYPAVGGSAPAGQFADLLRPRYLSGAEATPSKLAGGTYVACDVADFNQDGKIDLVYTSSGRATFYINTGRRDPGGLPLFKPKASLKAPGWSACRAVDLDQDNKLDLVIDGKYIRNSNPKGWPFEAEPPVSLNAGRDPCFLDVDQDGRLDAVCLQGSTTQHNGYQVAWRRNLGAKKSAGTPRFSQPQATVGIDANRAVFVAAVRRGGRQGLLVQDNVHQAVSFFQLVSKPDQAPRFERRFRAQSQSAVMSLSDQAWPCVCDWDADGDLDLLVGGGYGWPRIVINQGSNDRPAYAEPRKIMAQGKPIRFVRDEILGPPNSSHNMGYNYPAFVDWDADGRADLVFPNETNRIFWYKNIGTRAQPLFDKRRQVTCDGFPDSPKMRTRSAVAANDKNSNNGVYPYENGRPFFWRTGAAFADFNGDGLTDLVTHDGETRVATLFAQHRNATGELQLRKAHALKLVDGRSINDAIVNRRAHWTESFRAVDWDRDGLVDLVYSLAGSHREIQDSGSIYLLRNTGTTTSPIFEKPQALRCFGNPIRVTSHGPHPWVGDFDGDGKPDLLACVEWSVYPFYRHAALMMKERPQFKLGQLKRQRE